MVKLTKRKGFNFFRSYYDVYNELERNEDKVAFIDALIDRQFLGIKPKNLKGMAKFAYISQTNSIDSQVKGYEDKTKTKLTDNQSDTTPTVGGKVTPTVQVQVEEKGEVEEKETNTPKSEIDFGQLVYYFNKCTGKKTRVVPDKAKKQLKERLKNGYTKNEIAKAILNASNSKNHIENNYKHLTLELISRSEKFDMFLSMEDVKPITDKNLLYNDKLG